MKLFVKEEFLDVIVLEKDCKIMCNICFGELICLYFKDVKLIVFILLVFKIEMMLFFLYMSWFEVLLVVLFLVLMV